MKILLINKYYYVKGGSETYFFGLKKMLEDNGHTVIDFSMEDEKNMDSEYKSYFVDNINYGQDGSFLGKVKDGLKLINSKEASHKLCKLIEATKPDIAHVNLVYHQLTPSVFHALKKYNIPTVHTSHDYKMICPNYKMFNKGKICTKCANDKYFNCFINNCHKNSRTASLLLTIEAYYHKAKKSYDIADIIICPSNFMYSQLLKNGYPDSKLVHLPNFITNDFSTVAVNQGDDIKEDYLLYYGRLSEEKGIDVLLDAMKLVDGTCKLLIVGTGPERERLEQRVSAEGINNIAFLGFKSGIELQQLILKAKATVIPSIWHEVFGLTIIESFSMGTPVIGSETGGVRELIKNRQSGFLFERGNVRELSNSIRLLYSMDSSSYLKMSKQCITDAQTYSPNQYYRSLLPIYERLVSSKLSG